MGWRSSSMSRMRPTWYSPSPPQGSTYHTGDSCRPCWLGWVHQWCRMDERWGYMVLFMMVNDGYMVLKNNEQMVRNNGWWVFNRGWLSMNKWFGRVLVCFSNEQIVKKTIVDEEMHRRVLTWTLFMEYSYWITIKFLPICSCVQYQGATMGFILLHGQQSVIIYNG